VCVCVCVGFVMCVCFGNLCTCIYCLYRRHIQLEGTSKEYLYLLCFCIVLFMHIYSLYAFVSFCKLCIFTAMFMYTY